MSKICLIVGNGLSIDFYNYYNNFLKDWNPSNLLNWEVYTPGKPQELFLKNLPYFNSHLTNQQYADIDNYEIIKDILINNYQTLSYSASWDENYYKNSMTIVEMAHFLVAAYSHFQLQVDSINMKDWAWLTYIKKIEQNLSIAVSFNYDLILERSFEKSDIKFHRYCINEAKKGFPIFKPHGSIDFDVTGIRISALHYPLQNLIYKNNCSIISLNRRDLLMPRTEVDIVFPTETSSIKNYQWIKPGYDWFKSNGKGITQCIIVGLSYWECDRPEIDRLLGSFSQNTEVIVVDPKPSEDLIKKLNQNFSTVISKSNINDLL